MKNTLKLIALFLLFVVGLLAGCNGKGIELKDGDNHITKEVDEIISNYIIQKYSSVIEYIEPKDGSLFQSSLKRMFSRKICEIGTT